MTEKTQSSMQVFRDAEELATRAKDFILEAARESIRERGRFTLALAGGSTPEKVYGLIATDPTAMDWSAWQLFFGDERFVAPDDPRSNYGMAQRTLLSSGRFATDRIFQVPTDLPSPAEAAREYQHRLAAVFQAPETGAPPAFDLILLGMGDDGHTASLFPGAKALSEVHDWVTWSPPGVLPPPVDRVTFTFPLINAARRVLLLVSGGKKAATLHEVFEDPSDVTRFPVLGVHPDAGVLSWFLDADAARLLKYRPGT